MDMDMAFVLDPRQKLGFPQDCGNLFPRLIGGWEDKFPRHGQAGTFGRQAGTGREDSSQDLSLYYYPLLL